MTNRQETDIGAHKLSAAHRIEQALIEEISAGELLPGIRLDEVRLARRFGVSRTPVREALSRLTAQGVLVPGERRGAFVAEYSREQLSQIFEAMHEIEAACARIAAQRLFFGSIHCSDGASKRGGRWRGGWMVFSKCDRSR